MLRCKLSSAVSVRLVSSFPSDFAVAEDVGEAGESQAFSELQSALRSLPVAFLTGDEDIEVNLQCPVEAAGRELSCVSGELPDVVSVEDPAELSFFCCFGWGLSSCG